MMTLDDAIRINRACIQAAMLGEHSDAIALYSLADLLEAQRILAAENDRVTGKPGPKTIYSVMDDRMVAAVYVAAHYEGSMADDKGRYSPEPVVTVNRRSVVVLLQHDRMPWYDDVSHASLRAGDAGDER